MSKSGNNNIIRFYVSGAKTEPVSGTSDSALKIKFKSNMNQSGGKVFDASIRLIDVQDSVREKVYGHPYAKINGVSKTLGERPQAVIRLQAVFGHIVRQLYAIRDADRRTAKLPMDWRAEFTLNSATLRDLCGSADTCARIKKYLRDHGIIEPCGDGYVSAAMAAQTGQAPYAQAFRLTEWFANEHGFHHTGETLEYRTRLTGYAANLYSRHTFDQAAYRAKVGEFKSAAWAGCPRKIQRALDLLGYRYFAKSKEGRHFSAFNSCPKELRETILTDGKPTIELDVKNCQPLCLAALVRAQSALGEDDATDRFVSLCEDGKIYEEFALHLGLTGTNWKHLANKLDLPETESRRKIAKMLFVRALFGEGERSNEWVKFVWDFLREGFPFVSRWIRAEAERVKAAGQKQRGWLSRRLQAYEAAIIIPIVERYDAISIHDGIRCLPEVADDIERDILAAFKSRGVSASVERSVQAEKGGVR